MSWWCCACAGGRNGKVSSIVPHTTSLFKERERGRKKQQIFRARRTSKVVDNMKICEWQQLIRLKFCEWYLTSNFYFARDAGPSLSLSREILSVIKLSGFVWFYVSTSSSRTIFFAIFFAKFRAATTRHNLPNAVFVLHFIYNIKIKLISDATNGRQNRVSHR